MKLNKPEFYLLTLTALAALFKGGQYALLGRFLPLLVAGIPIVAVVLLVFRPGKLAKTLGKVWAWGLIAWGVIRVVIALVVNLTITVTENNIHEQMGVWGTCLSLLAIAAGGYLLRRPTLPYRPKGAMLRGDVR